MPDEQLTAPTIPTFTRQTLFRVFFFGAFLFLLYQFLKILSPFLTPLMGALTVTLIFFPFQKRVQRRLPSRPNLAAAITTASIVLMVIVPVFLFAWILVREAAVIYPAAQNWVSVLKAGPDPSLIESLPPSVTALGERIERFFGFWELDLEDIFLKNVDQLGKRISGFGGQVVKNLLFLAFDVLVMTFALFFFFRDGSKMARWVIDLIPMEKSHKDTVLQRLDRTLSAVVRGVFLTAATQGVLAGIGFTIVNIKFKVALSFATAFMAMIPFGGPVLIWLPVVIYLFMKGKMVGAIFLLLWGGLVVSLVDNFMKPYLIGEKAKLPIFLLFFGILGGLQVYGFIGVLVGPLMIASVLAFAKIYKEEFYQPPVARKASPATPPPPPLSG